MGKKSSRRTTFIFTATNRPLFVDQAPLLISPWPTSASRIVVVNPLAKISSLKFSRARSQSFRVGISQNSNLSATTTVLHRPPWQIVPLLSAIKTGWSTCNQNRLGHCNDLLQSEKKKQKKSISGGFHNPPSIEIAAAQNVLNNRNAPRYLNWASANLQSYQ